MHLENRAARERLPGGEVAGGIALDLPGHDVRLRATRWPGSPSPSGRMAGAPVVLLPALGSQRRFWNLVAPGLAGLPVLGPDRVADSQGELAWARARELGFRRAARLLLRPRLMRGSGGLHDVPLQWPALVSGLVRAVVDEVSTGAGAHRPEGGSG